MIQGVVEDLVALKLQCLLPAAEKVDLPSGQGQHFIHGFVDALCHLCGSFQVVAPHVDDIVSVVLDGDGGIVSSLRFDSTDTSS